MGTLPSRMTRTPWGDTEELRGRRLTPGHRLPRDEVDRIQGERLMGAMVAAVAERGYETTTVAHVVGLSGVSRTAFYRLFANKQECFTATFDAIVELAMDSLSRAWEQAGSWDERLLAVLETFVEVVVAQPAAARVCLLDVYVAGPEALSHADQALETFERMILRTFAESPERAGVPPLMVRGIVGGIREVISSRLLRGEAESLPALVPELWRWALTHTNPPEPIRTRTVRKALPPSPRFVAHDQAERIAAAVATIAARKGYAAMTIEEIVAEAATSLRTFYNHFQTKEDAFLAAYDVGLAQAFAAALPPYQRATGWRLGCRALAEALLTYLTVEPDWARMQVVEALAAGSRGMERRNNGIAAFSLLLQPGYEEAGDLPPIAAEATSGGIFTLIYDDIRRRGTDRLLELQPITTFFGLTPFIGPAEAAAIANQRTLSRPRKG
jgi:AcrR family transcriptional regulator